MKRELWSEPYQAMCSKNDDDEEEGMLFARSQCVQNIIIIAFWYIKQNKKNSNQNKNKHKPVMREKFCVQPPHKSISRRWRRGEEIKTTRRFYCYLYSMEMYDRGQLKCKMQFNFSVLFHRVKRIKLNEQNKQTILCRISTAECSVCCVLYTAKSTSSYQ